MAFFAQKTPKAVEKAMIQPSGILAKCGTLGYNPLAMEKKSLASMVMLSI
jgi:hypothetical protein